MQPLPFTTAQLWSAWERVQENAGCAGADGLTAFQFSPTAVERIPVRCSNASLAAMRTLQVPSRRLPYHPNRHRPNPQMSPTQFPLNRRRRYRAAGWKGLTLPAGTELGQREYWYVVILFRNRVMLEDLFH